MHGTHRRLVAVVSWATAGVDPSIMGAASAQAALAPGAGDGFDGSTPLQVVERGEIDRIWRMLFDLESVRSGGAFDQRCVNLDPWDFQMTSADPERARITELGAYVRDA